MSNPRSLSLFWFEVLTVVQRALELQSSHSGDSVVRFHCSKCLFESDIIFLCLLTLSPGFTQSYKLDQISDLCTKDALSSFEAAGAFIHSMLYLDQQQKVQQVCKCEGKIYARGKLECNYKATMSS